MAANSLIIFSTSDGWRLVPTAPGGAVVDVPVPANAEAVVRNAALTEALNAITQPRGGAVLLALSARECLCASIDTADLPARNRVQAMLYRFEESLPLSAEEVVAGFITTDSGRALAIGVERRWLDPVVEAIEAAGRKVSAICPASLLALQQWLAERDPKPSRGTNGASAELLLHPNGASGSELFILVDGMPRAWYALSDEPGDIALHVRMALLTEPKPEQLIACGFGADVLTGLEGLNVPVVPAARLDPQALAVIAGRRVLAGKGEPWVDLAHHREGGSGGTMRGARTASTAALVALLIWAAFLTAALFWRAARYEQLAASYDAAQANLFRDALPGQSIPSDVRSRLASEVQQLSRTSGGSTAGARASEQGLIVLRDVMSYLPDEVRFRVSEIHLTVGGFTLTGEVNSHGDAEAIAASLRRRAGFAVESPRTEQLPGRGVGFTIHGVFASGNNPTVDLERRASR